MIDGNLDNYSIYYTGINTQLNQGTNNSKLLPPKYPIDTLGLTGCVSLINLKLTNLKIVALGGINKINRNKLRLINCIGFAGISYFR